MITLSQSNKYEINIDEKKKGTILVSKFAKKIENYKMPFVFMPKIFLRKIGDGDYADFDGFIIASLNDYYNKLSGPGDLGTKEKMLDEYKRLYSIWLRICDSKEKENVLELRDLYNKMSYGLYLLGYEDNLL